MLKKKSFYLKKNKSGEQRRSTLNISNIKQHAWLLILCVCTSCCLESWDTSVRAAVSGEGVLSTLLLRGWACTCLGLVTLPRFFSLLKKLPCVKERVEPALRGSWRTRRRGLTERKKQAGERFKSLLCCVWAVTLTPLGLTPLTGGLRLPAIQYNTLWLAD